jgi:hypothetical protein
VLQALRILCAVALLTASAGARACPVCVMGPGLTPAQWLINADAVLLVTPANSGWKTVAVVKGSEQGIPAGGMTTEGVSPSTAVVAHRDPQSKKWSALGELPAEHAPWLRQVAGSTGTAEMTDADWQQRVAFYQPTLEHAVPLIAETSWGEIARAPYGAMRTLKPKLDARRIDGWLADPKLAPRSSLYTLLLGVAGGKTATDRIDASVARAAKQRDATDLSALLVADMELHGPGRVAWIEKNYLTDKSRSTPEVQAALLALSVQAGAEGAIPRGRIVESYRSFIRSGHPLAGYVAPDLTGWKDWSAVPDYVALLKSGSLQHPASIYAALMYLESSPSPEARATAAAFRARAASK